MWWLLFTGWVKDLSVTVILLVLAVAAVAALVYAIRARRREHVILAGLGELPGLPTAGFSQALRQRVRAQLIQVRQNASYYAGSAEEKQTVWADVVRDPHLVAEISSSAQDVLRQMSPPSRLANRGFEVKAVPLIRGDARLGIAVEVAYLHGPPIATETFWEPPSAADGDPAERLFELLKPTARWIALRLIAARSAAWADRRFHSRVRQTGVASADMQGVHQLLAGGLCRVAMADFEDQALTFAEDADSELRSAAEVLPGSHRPWEMLAGVNEDLGRLFARSERRDEAELAYHRAEQSWRRAEAQAAGRTSGTAERMRVRRLKCQVLSNRTEERPLVVQELAEKPLALDAMQMRTLYDTARLYATLNGEFTEPAKDAVGRALLAEPNRNVQAMALGDPELLAVTGLASFLNRLVQLRGQATEPILGDEATALISQAKE